MKNPVDHLPASEMGDIDLYKNDRDAWRTKKLERHEKAVAYLKSVLKVGDRIYATRGECCATPQTYTFDGWDGEWIVSKSGINTIIPASVRLINRKVVEVNFYES